MTPIDNGKDATKSKGQPMAAVSHLPQVKFRKTIPRPAKESPVKEKAPEPDAANDQGIEVSTTLTDLVQTVIDYEEGERKRMASERQDKINASQQRLLKIMSSRSAAQNDELLRQRNMLAQSLSDHNFALAQEYVSAYLKINSNDTEVRNAQRAIDAQFTKIGEPKVLQSDHSILSMCDGAAEGQILASAAEAG